MKIILFNFFSGECYSNDNINTGGGGGDGDSNTGTGTGSSSKKTSSSRNMMFGFMMAVVTILLSILAWKFIVYHLSQL